jgi:hypothetical protein
VRSMVFLQLKIPSADLQIYPFIFCKTAQYREDFDSFLFEEMRFRSRKQLSDPEAERVAISHPQDNRGAMHT